MGGTVELDVDGAIAVITHVNERARNAFDDDMDEQLSDIVDEIASRSDIRAVIWRGEGPAFSSGRDVAAIKSIQVDMTHHELMSRVHQGNRHLLELDVPVIAALHGWTIGISFQRALLCDIRIAADDTRLRLPEIGYGLIPDGGGVSRISEICGPGVATDLVLTARTMDVEEALAHGIVSRVVPRDELDDVCRTEAENIAAAPRVATKMATRVIGRIGRPPVIRSMEEEMITQTFLNQSQDFREMIRARKEDREPAYRNS